MIRTISLGGAMLLLAALAGCDRTPADAEAKAQEAQRRADQAIDDAQREANKKATQAQQRADDELQRAAATLATDREKVRSTTLAELDTLNTKIARIETRASKATGKQRVELDSALKELHDKLAAARNAVGELEQATPQTFDAIKHRIDTSLDELKKAVDTAAART